ncbi:MAG: chorismate mutase [Chitinivibrionales bacterium]|nr:chorismate mutase [Chitinivibrionales bacterium]
MTTLARVAALLEGLEETIIFKLIDRAQFRVNEIAYVPGKSGFEGEHERSLFVLRLRRQEEMDAMFGRYCVPEERPFTTELPAPRRVVTLGDTGLYIEAPDLASVTGRILESYLDLLPSLCATGDDGQYGSSVEHDVYALQALSRRIHFGAFHVAESKYRDDPQGYTKLINEGDRDGLLRKLTRKEVEDAIIARVREKVGHAQARVNRDVRVYVEPDLVTGFYRDHVIPLTKESEVHYLLKRKPDAWRPARV